MDSSNSPGANNGSGGEPAVFVDDTGRKQRILTRSGYVLGIVCVSFLAIVGVGLATEGVGPSNAIASMLPGPFMLPAAAVGQVQANVIAPVAAARPAPPANDGLAAPRSTTRAPTTAQNTTKTGTRTTGPTTTTKTGTKTGTKPTGTSAKPAITGPAPPS